MYRANEREDRNVVNDPADPTANQAGARFKIEELLKRYPEVSEGELAEVLYFLAKGKHLEVGAIAGADLFRGKVAEIKKLHRRYFRPRPLEAIIFLSVVAGPPVALMANYLL